MSEEIEDRAGFRLIFVRWITTRSGRRLPPPAGKRAWAIWVKDQAKP